MRLEKMNGPQGAKKGRGKTVASRAVNGAGAGRNRMSFRFDRSREAGVWRENGRLFRDGFDHVSN